MKSVAQKHLNSANPLTLLRSVLEARCRKNPSYSIRAFSRASGISVTVLSLALSGKRRLSKKATLQLAAHLNLDPQAQNDLLAQVLNKETSSQTLALDSFQAISDWHHYAILSALEIPGASLDARWMSKQLGISLLDAKLAIERLQRLELVEQKQDGTWKQTGFPLKIDNKISTTATRKFHKQLLEKAAESIDKDPIEHRDFSSMTFAMNEEQIEYARKKIQKFRRQLIADLESRAQPSAVYQLTIQLFPLTPIKNKQEK